MARVLLIQPPTMFIQQAYGIKKKNVSFGHAPPLGLGYIASYLEMDGHQVTIMDASARELTMEQAVQEVVEANPDWIGITAMTNYIEQVHTLSRQLKERLPQVPIVLGGAHATYFYRETLEEIPAIDHVIYGEADRVIRDYARCLHDPASLWQLPSLAYRDHQGQVRVNPPAPLVESMDEVPMPAWHLYDFSLYRPLPLQYRRQPFFTMITSRGCWWRRCKFCFQAGFCAVKFRRHSPRRVVDEIEILYHRHGIREIAFWDDTFIMNERWLGELAALLKERRLDISWVASGRANTMNENILRIIRDAGCWSMFVGVESGNQDLLDMIEKGITLEQVREVFRLAKKIGIQTRGAFMLGLPGETPEKAKRTIDFAIEIDPTYAIFYATYPRYGTELYEIAKKSGQFLHEDFRGMSKVTYVPEGYASARQLEDTIRSAYRRFYVRPSKIAAAAMRLRSWTTVKELAKAYLLYLGLSHSAP